MRKRERRKKLIILITALIILMISVIMFILKFNSVGFVTYPSSTLSASRSVYVRENGTLEVSINLKFSQFSLPTFIVEEGISRDFTLEKTTPQYNKLRGAVKYLPGQEDYYSDFHQKGFNLIMSWLFWPQTAQTGIGYAISSNTSGSQISTGRTSYGPYWPFTTGSPNIRYTLKVREKKEGSIDFYGKYIIPSAEKEISGVSSINIKLTKINIPETITAGSKISFTITPGSVSSNEFSVSSHSIGSDKKLYVYKTGKKIKTFSVCTLTSRCTASKTINFKVPKNWLGSYEFRIYDYYSGGDVKKEVNVVK